MAELLLEEPVLVWTTRDHVRAVTDEHEVEDEVRVRLGDVVLALDTDDAMRFVGELDEVVRAALASRGRPAA